MAKKPKIRFKGFTEEWKDAPLSDYLSVSTERNEYDRYTAQDIQSVSGEYGVVNQIEYQGRSFAGASLLNYRVIHNGEIAYTKSPLRFSPYGIIKANKGVTGIVSALYGVYKVKQGDANFIQCYFDLQSRLNNYLRPLVNKGAKNTLLITDEDAIAGKVFFPKTTEQKEIASFIDDVTSTIRQREKELEKLKNIKLALLEKLFPQDGQNIPAIRFKGFNEKWDEGQIGDAFRERDERSGNGELLSVTINSGIRRAKDMERTFTTGDLNKYKVVRKGDIAYNTMRMWQGACGVSEYSGIVSPAYTIAMPQEGHVSAFYAYYFKSNRMLHDFRINSQGLTSDTWNLKYPSFARIKAYYPHEKEQGKIASAMLQLDKLLSLRERQLTLLKHTKQALLEQMFVNE